TEPADLPVWQGLADLLLTKTGSRRKKVDKRDGFPAGCKAEKARLLALAGQLEQTPVLLARLDFSRALPPANYSEQQWQLLAALIQVLPLAVAQLRLVFAQTGQVDFPELAHAAQRALGQIDAPTDLALRLDYRLQHILIDEFQDTSNSQWSLLQLLTAGWQPGDGRTLFLVGDPMQSIYRFREAEVGLYLHAWSHGLGDINLVPLSLTVNFRSTAGIVDWVNDCFAAVMPQQSDATSAAVAYAPSIAWRAAGTAASVSVHPQYALDLQQEADIVSNILADCGNRHCAILVQNRNHLLAIVPRLRAQGIAFRAVEIERLGQQPVVLDLLALTRALIHPADRIAWLSVLRAPWCGLTRADLHALARYEVLHTQAMATLPTVLQQLADQDFVADGLSVTGSKILQRIWPCLQQALLEQRRGLLRDSVERLWLQLGGASAVDSVTALTDAQAYFELLEHTEVGADLESAAQLERELERLFAAPDTQTTDDDLQILTIHKAKGLEFDNVILPGLGRPGRHDDPKLLLWQERQRDQDSELLLAPLTATGAERDQVYAFVNRLEQERSAYERGRLLYVAATRAREQLHLLGHVNVKANADGEIETAKPKAGSALALLWPQLEAVYQQSLPSTLPDTADTAPVNTWQPQRLPADWTLPALPDTDMSAAISAMASTPVTATADYSPEYWWAGETARAVGIVVHRLLMRIAAEGVDAWPAERLTAGTALIKHLLQQQGLAGAACETAAGQVLAALQSTLADDRGRWLLAAEHREAANEYALNRLHDGRLETVVLDRTFVDKDDVRWIVDYKTGSHAGTDIDTFLEREQERYRPQLERYAEFMRVLDQRPIRLGLYFPLLKCWREWAAS
ncbi:MAG: 3'-5' exonuclease, partial [Gammaproteobacteria bacterium]